MMKNKIIFFLLLVSFIPKVYALSGTIVTESKTIKVGESANINVNIKNVSDVMAIGGTISTDESCLKINSVNSNNGMVRAYEKSFVYQSLGDITASNIVTVNITGLKACSAKINVINATLTSGSMEETNAIVSAGTISVEEQVVSSAVSNEGTKSSTTTTVTSQENTQQTNNVENTNKNIDNTQNSSASNSKTSVSTNQSTQSSGNNVKSNTSSNTKAVSSTTNEIAIANNDLSLSSLSVEGYEINFNKNNLEYTLEVENNVESIDVKAIASNNSATIKILNNENLLVGENEVKIVVTNNNEEKTYVIKVTRKQDPNKEYNTDNYLTNIVPSVGILSPLFNKDISDYIIYVPYEVDNITFENTLSAPDTSVIEVDEPSELIIGDNIYTIKVRAESGDIRKYNIIVKKFNKYDVSLSNNNLRSITLENNTLLNSKGEKIEFDKDITTYYYRKGDDFSYNFVVDDPNAIVKVVENGDTVNIIVEAPNGDIKVYTLIPYEINTLIYILLFVLGIAIGFVIKTTYILYKKHKKRKIKKDKINKEM